MADETLRNVYGKLLKRRDDLQAQIEALSMAINAIRSAMNDEKYASGMNEEQPELDIAETNRAAYSAKIHQMMDETRRIIIGERRPMKRGELVEILHDKGFEIHGADKRKVFGTNIWRSKQFVTVDTLGYWPKDVELPTEFRQLPIREP